MHSPVRWIFLPLALAFAAPALAQDAGEGEAAPATASDDAPLENDIVVRALRLRADEELPVEVSPSPSTGRVSRNLAADAERFTRCAGLPRPELLRRILDGRPETGETEKALHLHIVRNSGCFKGMPQILWQRESPYYGECNPIVLNHEYGQICRVHYDRGAIYERVLREYAPDLRLSRSNTFDIATRDRFRKREEQRNTGRKSGADDYFFTAACMVQLRPEFALALLREEPGSEREARLRGMMINDGAACLGATVADLERVRIDPNQFRAFGGILIGEPLCELELHLNKARVVIYPPFRMGHPSFRANPQINRANVESYLGGFQGQFPLQLAAYPTISDDGEGKLNFWPGYGEADRPSESSVDLPADSIRTSVFQKDGARLHTTISNYVLAPLLEGIRNETDQWWAGRSYESIGGLLHFIVPLDSAGEVVGRPSATCASMIATDDVRLLTNELWKAASEYVPGRVTNTAKSLMLDAFYAFASGERRAALVLAASAIEAARDAVMERESAKIADLGTSQTDLLKHLTVGFEKLLGRNLEKDDEGLYEDLRAIWIARGDAAHGRPIFWRRKGFKSIPVIELESSVFIGALRKVHRWVLSC